VTKDAFIHRYAKGSGYTIEQLLKRMEARPCDCQEEGCKGWKMVVVRDRNGNPCEVPEAK